MPRDSVNSAGGTPSLLRSGSDGRALRGRRSRGKVVVACRKAMLAGQLTPTAKDVARRARVSIRLVFHHFPRLGELYEAALNDEPTQRLLLLLIIDSPLEVHQLSARSKARLLWALTMGRTAAAVRPLRLSTEDGRPRRAAQQRDVYDAS